MLYKVLIDMRAEVDMLKNAVNTLAKGQGVSPSSFKTESENKFSETGQELTVTGSNLPVAQVQYQGYQSEQYQTHEEVEESLSLEANEKDLIEKALEKHRGKRKYAAQDLGISERTLYRKIKEYDLN